MEFRDSGSSLPTFFYRCAGPNCGAVKTASDRWWLLWTSFGEFNRPVLYLCAWDEEIAAREGALYVCGELCAQRLQSQFMGNVREGQTVQSHDILYKMSLDILYTPARARRARGWQGNGMEDNGCS